MIAVRSLHVYPVKSAAGISLSRAEVGDRGFQHDRRFMIVDGAGQFLTQRMLPRMALISVALSSASLRVTGPGMRPLEIPLVPSGGSLRTVQVWRDRCEALSLGPGPARWLSELLGVTCELVYMPEATLRAVDPLFGPGRVGFADGYPFLLASTASLDDLSRRGASVPMERFRPNIVVDGAPAFAEDHWKRVRIGPVEFRVVKPCARCAITTVDPALGVFSGPEPLRTLAEFRRSEEGVLFGMNLVHEGAGVVSVGDEVTVLDP
jgi:uncharacterized protein YcbX